MKISLMLAAFLSFVLVNPSLVVGESGNSLLGKCQDAVSFQDTSKAKNSENAVYCWGFVSGVMSTMQVGNTAPKMMNACIPESNPSVTAGQAVRIVTKYLKARPENLHLPSTLLVMDAFRKAFPCEKNLFFK